MAARLKSDSGVADSVRHGPPLVNGERERLLAVDVLSRARRGNRHVRVPVIGSTNVDGTDVWPREHLTKSSYAAQTLPP